MMKTDSKFCYGTSPFEEHQTGATSAVVMQAGTVVVGSRAFEATMGGSRPLFVESPIAPPAEKKDAEEPAGPVPSFLW